MYRLNSYISIALIALSLMTSLLTQARAAENPFILVDAVNGNILASNKADDRWYPASLTKMMTAYVTFRAIAAGEIKEGSPVTISPAARRQPPSKMGYKQGVQLRMDTALKIIIVKSANDVSLALGEAVAGSLPAFVKRMNREADRLGLTNTHFTNSNGLHSVSQYTSARDMAVLASQILREFPQYAYMFGAAAIKTSQNTHYSYNLLLERFRGSNGMKTGFVCASGYNMVATASRAGRTLIAVVLGRSSQTDRAVSAAQLLDAGFKGNVTPSGSIYLATATNSAKPKNMRPILCTEAARKNRYDPGAGQAKINSKFLSARVASNNILNIQTGGVDAPPGAAVLTAQLGEIPIPMKRPNKPNLSAIGDIRTGRIGIPKPRPQ